ncbi:hypothetical protein Adt_45726 [Abeliophyllum distichum]|uniref:Uncharacterized protein n=1 Tax=Abeliophyllum distichum TaxID=126358 RepID=A0ABD1PEG4_9LAMI
MAEVNQTIPPEIRPNSDDDAPWECLPMPYAKQQDIEIHMKKSYPKYNYYQLPQHDSDNFDVSWGQLYFGRPTHSLGQTSKYGKNSLEAQAHQERFWKMLHDNIASTPLTSSTPQEPVTSSHPIITPYLA